MLRYPIGENRMSRQQDTLRINRKEKRFLGVCAGIADYLDLPVILIRVIFVVSILTWPTLLLAYFCVYICLDKNITTDKVQEFFNSNNPSDHFKNLNFRRPIFRNVRNKRIAGVCSGVADYLEVSPFTVRILAVVSLVILGPYAVLAYIVGWFAMEPNPAPRFNDRPGHRKTRMKNRYARYRNRAHRFSSSRINIPEDDSNSPLYDQEYDSAAAMQASDNSKTQHTDYTENPHSRDQSMEQCSDIYYSLESRLREIEAFMTSKKFRLHCEINRI